MQQFCERSGGALGLYHLSAFFLDGQLAKNAGSHALGINYRESKYLIFKFKCFYLDTIKDRKITI